MKCIRCGTDSKLKERTGGKCPRCSGRFAFEPTAGDPYTDKRFQSAIQRVSSGGKVRFLKEHVRQDLARDNPNDPALWIAVVGVGVFVVMAMLALGGVEIGLLGMGPAAGIAVVAAVVRYIAPPERGVDRPKFEGLWARYVNTHGAPTGLLTGPKERRGPRKEVREELVQYSFDRAVICDRPQTVEVLLANDFHFENNCAVLSVDGYPPELFQTVRTMLRNNPRLEVFVLHDATPYGCALATHLRSDPSWFAGHATVYDVALRPAQADRWRNHREPAESVVTAGEGISPSEAKWLSRWQLTLESLPPEQLIRRLFRAMHHLPTRRDAGGGDGGLVFVGDTTTIDVDGDGFG